MNYQRRYFDPAQAPDAVTLEDGSVACSWTTEGTRDAYVFHPRVILAINLALATGRPLLITGEPGSGKSTLARTAALVLRRRYYRTTVTSRTQATDLLWTYDALRRLRDASSRDAILKPDRHYVSPGPLWWGFDPASATGRGHGAALGDAERAVDPGEVGAPGAPSLVLVDEIDKADPDVPNDLLEPFDVRRFTVRETNDVITAQRDAFLMLTTNGERDLPPAFLRRCVLLALGSPNREWFIAVARRHDPEGDAGVHAQLADAVIALRGEADKRQLRKPSTAEFLDALKVWRELDIKAGDQRWHDVVNSVLLKNERQQPGSG